MNWTCRPLDLCPCLPFACFLSFLLSSLLGGGWVSSQRLFRTTVTDEGEDKDLYDLVFSILCRLFSGAGLTEIPAVPGGPGISVNPCGRWTRSSGSTHTSASRSTSRPVRPEFFLAISRSFRSGNPAVSVWSFFSGLVAVSRFGVRVCFFGFSRVFLGFSGGVVFPFFCLLCCLALLHLLSRERASAGKPAAMAPDPPPVVN